MIAPRLFVAVLSVAGLVAGCSSGAGLATPTTSHRDVPRSCDSTGQTSLHWPAGVPAAMPRPPGGHVKEAKSLPHGVVVEVAVPSSLRRQVIFVRHALPRAGFTLGRGDAEADEADIPFRRHRVSGQVKIRAGGACAATWILTVLRG